MWELVLDIFGPALLEIVSGLRKPRGNIARLNAGAKAHFRAGRYAEAETLYRKALAVRQAHFGEKHFTSGYYLNHLGITVQRQERYEEASVLFQSALKIYKEVEGPNSRNVAQLLGNLGYLRLRQQAYREAEDFLTRALAGYERLAESEPICVLRVQKSLAWVYYHQERNDQAASLADRTRAGLEQNQETNTLLYLDCIELLCCLSVRQMNRADRIPILRLVKEKRECLGLTNDPRYPVWLGLLGAALLAKKQLMEAEPLLVQAIARKREARETDTEGFILNLCQIGLLYTMQERFENAEAVLAEGLRLSRRVLPPDSRLHRVVLVTCARRCYCQEQAAETIPFCEEYLQLYSKTQADEVKLMLLCRMMLGRMYGRLGKYWQAEVQLLEVQTVSRARSGEESVQYASALAYLGEWNHLQGRDTEALSLVMQALELFPRVHRTSGQAWKTARSIAIEILESRGQWSQAAALRSQRTDDLASVSHTDDPLYDLP